MSGFDTPVAFINIALEIPGIVDFISRVTTVCLVALVIGFVRFKMYLFAGP